MKRWLVVCLMLASVLTLAAAKGEEDFASRYLALYGRIHSVECKTISPQMMERIMLLEAGEEEEATRQVLAQIKSIRILTGGETADDAKDLFEKAEQLARRNKRRYNIYAQAENRNIYTRRHGEQLVEFVVLCLKDDHTFYLLNLTGNMSDDFLQQVLRI